MKFITGIIACGLKLNKFFEDKIEIKKGQPVFFFVVVPEKLKFQHVLCKTKAKKEKKRTRQKTRRQTGGFLSRYDFAFAGRDTFI